MTTLFAFTLLLFIFCAVVYVLLLRKLDKANQLYEDARETLRQSNAALNLTSYRDKEAAQLTKALGQRLNQIEASINSLN